jgi:hypothetical protein
MRDNEAHITAPTARLGADGGDDTVKFSARRRSVVLQGRKWGGLAAPGKEKRRSARVSGAWL